MSYYDEADYALANLDDFEWEKAEEYIQKVRMRYTEIGAAGMPALKAVIEPLYMRFKRGERSKELYNEIMSLE